MFGRRRREETEELLKDARDRLDSSARQTARLVDAITALNSTISTGIEHSQQLETTADATVSALQHALSAEAGDLATALTQVASTYGLLAQRIEDDRLDRGALAEAVRKLAIPPAPVAPVEPARPRVLGGSVYATPATDRRSDIVRDDTVDLVDDTPFAIGTAVCCRFGDQWINGVEVVELVGNPTRPAYRLRRHQDGYVLPALFGARDLRPAQSAPSENGTAARSHWARS